MYKNKIISSTMLATSISIFLSGCTILLPAHTRSNERASEKFSLTLLKKISYCAQNPTGEINEFWQKYEAAYGVGSKESQCATSMVVQKDIGKCIPKDSANTRIVIPAAIASAALGLATDFLKQKLEEEKSLYTAQYTAKLVDDEFWTVQAPNALTESCKLDDGKDGLRVITTYSLTPNYIGFKAEREINNPKNSAAKFFYGFKQSADGRFIQIRPLYLNIAYSKTKVLSNEWFTWLPPFPLITKLFKVSDETIDIELATTMEAYWVEKGKSFDGPKTIAAFKTSVDGYSLNNDTGTNGTAILDAARLNVDPGWMFSPPISGDLTNYISGSKAGNFRITVSVTERDTSEATKYIEKSEEWLSKGSEQLKSSIEK